ncbi:MAG: carbohydrate-binding domain-containing protein, partial [Treponemataceae bacterium]|nr:carbohydrate-binding domain-containing protein [Treponemataceae bacterium]
MKYVLKILNFLLACFILASCVLEADETITDESTTSASGSSFSANTYIFINLSDIQASEDDSAYYSLSSTETYFLSGNVGITYSNNLIKVDATGIEANLWVYLEGTMTTGGVKIQTSEDYEIGLFLNAVTMTSSNYPCIDCTKGGAVTVCLYGSNVLTDGRQYGYGYGEEYTSTSANPVSVGSDSKGTLYCKGGLSIYESASGGSLTVYQAYKNCIASKAGILY